MNIMRNTICLTVALAVGGVSFAAIEREDPSVNSVNRLPPRTYAMPLADESAALTDALEPSTPYRKSLNGRWKFSWTGNPELRVKEFWKLDFDDSDWFDIEVPGCVELSGFGSPGYTNWRYPHANLSHPTNTHFATVRDRLNGKPDYNPVSSYRCVFTVPGSWKGRRVILRFDGVSSAYYVWVNGKRVGYAEDSRLPSEFDITGFLVPADNILAVEVYRWCDGSFLEDQDMTRLSGIFRDVTLWSMPKDGIWDFTVRTHPLDGYESWSLELELENGGSASLYDSDGKKVGDLTPLSNSNYQLQLKPRIWSAERPYLYTLVLKKGADIRMKRIGFKEQKIVGHTFLVNGRKVKFKGVNRHETNPERGYSVTLDDMIRDITLMKRYNINTVRTSHYPDHYLWYDLCDRYGIYLCAEANVEGHEPGGEGALGLLPEWEHSIVERNERHVRFYRNNPSVTVWSLGNETGHGDNFCHAIDAVKRADPTRPVHFCSGNLDADIDSCMYPSVEWLEARGKFGDRGESSAELDWAIDSSLPYRHTANKVFFLCEYAHAMGNAIGNLAEYWDAFYRYDSLSGGCIWDWIDQALWKETGKMDPRTGKPERFLSYGGDNDELPNDGPFNCNGVIGPGRNVTAKLVEVGHVYRNLVVTRSADSRDNGFAVVFELWNRFCFTRADEFTGIWRLRENGKVTAVGGFEPPALEPLSRCRFTVTGLAEALSRSATGAELLVDFEFATKGNSLWAEKGWVVARDQVSVGAGWDFPALAGGHETASPLVGQDERTVTVTAGRTKAVFCRNSGTLCELVMNGRTVLRDAAPGIVSGPRLTCMRALTDNDAWMRRGNAWTDDFKRGSVYFAGMTQLRYHARPLVVKDGAVRSVVEVTGSKSAGFTHESVWSFLSDGSVLVKNTVTPHGSMPPALPRLGLSLRLDSDLEALEYYGRGPYENYVDRCTGSFLGRWASTVTDQFEPYVRPQDNGGKSDVRWVQLTAKDGKGVRFSASEPMFVQALHYDWEDLEFARHRNEQQRFRTPLVPRSEVFLNLDVRQTGLGGGSCGPEPLGKYVFQVEPTEWTVRMSPSLK